MPDFILKITLGSLLRFCYTVGAAWEFAKGNMLMGFVWIGCFAFTTWLESK
jgi:hypothetical protein